VEVGRLGEKHMMTVVARFRKFLCQHWIGHFSPPTAKYYSIKYRCTEYDMTAIYHYCLNNTYRVADLWHLELQW